MRKILMISLLGLLNIGQISAQGVNFRKDLSLEKLKETAVKEHKNIFLDVMATWCGPCKTMDQTVYPDAELGKFFLEKFISVKVQTDITKNDNEFVRAWYASAKEIMNRYQVTGLPSMVFLSPEGTLLYKSVGFRNKEELLSDAKRALNPAGRYDMLLEEYYRGNRNKAFITQLISQTDSMGRGIMAQKIAYDVLGNVKDSTAYAVLSFLSKSKPSKIPNIFSGNWDIDYPACDFGDKPLRAAAKKLNVLNSSSGMEISRVSAGLSGAEVQSKENLLASANESVSATATENRKKRSRMFVHPDGKSFTEFSEYTFVDDRAIDYVIVEFWSMLSDGRLSILKSAYMNGGSYALKLIYRKK